MWDDLAILTRMYFTTQKIRIMLGNRISAIESGRCRGDAKLVVGWHQIFQAHEDQILREMVTLASTLPAWEWLCAVKGIGEPLAARLLGSMPPFEQVPKVSKFWRLCGYGLDPEGRPDRPRKGQRLPYRKTLKSLLFVVGQSFLRTGSPFAAVYYESKEYYQKNRPGWTKMHVHMASMRRMIKTFLACLWEVGRVESGAPISPVWAVEIGGHKDWIRPWDFVEDYEYWWRGMGHEEVNRILAQAQK